MVARISVGCSVWIRKSTTSATQKDGYKEMTCNVPTCVHRTSVRESMCSLVPVIVCKVGNLAEMNHWSRES